MKKSKFTIFIAMIICVLILTSACGKKDDSNSGKVTITYWQYTFPQKVDIIKDLIKKFEAENPNIKVVAQDFPYDQYNQKIAAAVNAKKPANRLSIKIF